jgi:hypothetical protein
VEFRILEPLEISADDVAIKAGEPKQRALLAHPPSSTTRGAVGEEL